MNKKCEQTHLRPRSGVIVDGKAGRPFHRWSAMQCIYHISLIIKGLKKQNKYGYLGRELMRECQQCIDNIKVFQSDGKTRDAADNTDEMVKMVNRMWRVNSKIYGLKTLTNKIYTAERKVTILLFSTPYGDDEDVN